MINCLSPNYTNALEVAVEIIELAFGGPDPCLSYRQIQQDAMEYGGIWTRFRLDTYVDHLLGLLVSHGYLVRHHCSRSGISYSRSRLWSQRSGLMSLFRCINTTPMKRKAQREALLRRRAQLAAGPDRTPTGRMSTPRTHARRYGS